MGRCLCSLVVISGLLVACRRPIEVRGLYVSDDGSGAFFPCDQPNMILQVSDSALATSYRLKATQPYQLLFVRLRGVRADSGSIYGGSHHFLVQQILEIRARRNGECPSIAHPVPPTLLLSVTGLPNKGVKLTVRSRDPSCDAGRAFPERYIVRLRTPAPRGFVM